jgi:decaprenyl-phosphate phosphoribosyltransferase
MNMIDVASCITLLRPKQWLKNIFVAIPLFLGGRLLDLESLLHTLAAVGVFCLLSSAVYVLNDLRDREADSVHPKKRKRPIASGAVSTAQAIFLMGFLVAAACGLFIATDLAVGVAAVLSLYAGINIAYSYGLKHVTLLELFLVASGFVLRLLAGGLAIALPLSSWLIAMTGVVAMLIVTAKRRGEIAEGHDPEKNRRSLSSYNLTFLDSTISMLAGMTIVFYLLFATSEYGAHRYGHYGLLIAAPALAYGVLRYVQIVKVSTGADDPTELLVTDRGLHLSTILFGAIFFLMLYG